MEIPTRMKLLKQYTISEICSLANIQVDNIKGDQSIAVTGINEIHKVEPGDITFVDHPKYYDKALKSAATFIFINKEVDVPEGKVLIVSEDPFNDYVAIVKHFKPYIPSEAAISPDAEIGEGTVIEPFVFIGRNVKIGKNCIIFPNVSIHADTVIGDNVIINSGNVSRSEAFVFKRRPDKYDKLEGCGRVIIEDNVEVGSCCTIDKGVSGDTVIGKGTKMDNHIQIGHDTVLGKNCLISSQVGIAGVVTLEDDVILWGQVGVQKDLTIGKGAVVLGQSGVAKSIEGGKTYFGSPVREAVDKMKELALIKRLPEVFEKLT